MKQEVNINERVTKAEELFKEGYNCSQSVVAAYSDIYSIPKEQALLISASFGGGIGRMRETCGAACGMILLTGLESGTTDPADREGKSNNYKDVRDLAAKFAEENGSLICAELLGLKKMEESHVAEERTKAYYKKRPCVECVKSAAKIFGEYLKERGEQ